MVVLLNKGPRTWDLHDGVEIDGKIVRREKLPDGSFNPKDKVVKRKLLPGASIETLDQAEADHMLGYRQDIVDGDKIMPQQGDKLKALQDQVASLTEEIGVLKSKLAKYEEEAEEDDKKGGKKK